MITKSDYNKAKKIVDQYNKEQNDYSGYAKITCEGSFVAKVLKTDLHDWIDKFLAKKLKNKPGKYSERMWDKLNEYEVHVDGESYILVSYDDKLSDKWLGSGLNITIKTWPDGIVNIPGKVDIFNTLFTEEQEKKIYEMKNNGLTIEEIMIIVDKWD